MNIIDQMRGEFLAEAEEILDEINADLLHLEEVGPGKDPDLVDKVMRAAHSLKGSSGMFGLDDLSASSHALEGMLEEIHSGRARDVANLIEAGIDMVDVMRRYLAAASRGDKRPRSPDPGIPAEGGAFAGPVDDPDTSRFLRIDFANLDRALNLVGDLFLQTTLLRDLQRSVCHGQGLRGVYRNQAETTRLIDHRLSELRETLLEMRMVPLGKIFKRLIPAVRSVAKARDKKVRLNIEGGDTGLDKAMAEKLSDPLMHLIRNAIDHGVEPPAEREALGKAAEAEISLAARREGAEVIIEVRDDGRGVQTGKVLAKARARGLLPEDRTVGEQEILDCLFAPGFSTADEVDCVSGRGVGMDVVRTNIARLSGTVGIRTQSGRGTTVTIRVPPTLSTVDGLLVGISAQTAVLPFHAVSEVLRISTAERAKVAEEGILTLRDCSVRAAPLGPILGFGKSNGHEHFAVVVGREPDRSAILVDTLGERIEVLVKPLGPRLDSLPNLSGVTELADGRLALVLDAGALAGGLAHTEGSGA